MSTVLIVVNAETCAAGRPLSLSPVTEKMVAAMQQAVLASGHFHVEVVAAAALWSESQRFKQGSQSLIYCPLTIQLPDTFEFPAKSVFHACKDIQDRRDWVAQRLNSQILVENSWLGDLWLPIALTAKGPLYGEVIGEGIMPNSYEQPVDLTDPQRQQLYHLAYELLRSIQAVPSVYLLQFSLRGPEILFDRLWPFPAAPAIASLGIQQPDLFTCHWQCLARQPLRDLRIPALTIH